MSVAVVPVADPSSDDAETDVEMINFTPSDSADRADKVVGEFAPAAAAPASSSIVNELINADAIYSVDKMAHVLKVGPDTERDFVLFELNQLLEHCPEETLKTLVPVICENVASWSINVQFRVGEGLVQVVHLVLQPETAWLIVSGAISVVSAAAVHMPDASSERESFFDLWAGIIVDALAQVNWGLCQHTIPEVLRFIDECSDRTEVPEQRKLGARLLAPLGSALPPEAVSQLLLPRALKLTSDFNTLVRGTVAASLAGIGETLSLKKVEEEVWPSLVALLEDVDSRIRAATLRTIGRILAAQRSRPDLYPDQTRLFRELLPPVFVRWSMFAKKAASNDQRMLDDDTYLLLEVVAEVFGELLYSTSLYKDNVFRKHAIRAFLSMATCNGPLIRRNCAYNIPGVALTLHEKYGSELCTIVECLTRDVDEEVRWILAAGFHETLRILFPIGRQDKLLTSFGALVHDQHSTVRQHVLEHFSESVAVLSKDGDLNAVRKLTPILQDIGDVVDFPWRSQEKFAREIDKCARLLPPTLLLDKILPALFSIVQNGNRVVKGASIRAIVRGLRYIPDIYARDVAIANFWAKCLDGNYAMRLAFILGGKAAMEIFSQNLFRQLFAPRLLLVIRDRVINVRLALAHMLPSMAVSCARLSHFGNALQILRRDADPSVRLWMRRFHQLAGKEMQESSRTLDADIQKMREEAGFFGQARRVNAMKPSVMTVVKEKVSSKTRSKDGSVGATSGDVEVEGGAGGDGAAAEVVGSSGRLDVRSALSRATLRHREAQPMTGSLLRNEFEDTRSDSFTSLPDLGRSLSPKGANPQRRSKSLKGLLGRVSLDNPNDSFDSVSSLPSSPTSPASPRGRKPRGFEDDAPKPATKITTRISSSLGLGSPGGSRDNRDNRDNRADAGGAPMHPHGPGGLKKIFKRLGRHG